MHKTVIVTVSGQDEAHKHNRSAGIGTYPEYTSIHCQKFVCHCGFTCV
jgi:hypothetical protein